MVEPGRKRRRWPKVVLVVLLVVTGLAGIAGGGGVLAFELNRPPTRAEISAAARAEVATRWERLPAGQIFPARVSYLTADGIQRVAVRVGIARPAPCSAALDPALVRLLGKECHTVLRATYADATGTLVATLGIAALPSTADGARIESGSGPAGGWEHTGVRAVSFPGTVAGTFGDDARAAFGAQFRGPYIFLATAGYADGRAGRHVTGAAALSDLAGHLADPSMSALTSIAQPCARKDITC